MFTNKFKFNIITITFVTILFMMFCSPLMVDDYYFLTLDLQNFNDSLEHALKYGNGRLLGNLGIVYLLKYPIIKIFIKSACIFMIIIIISRLLKKEYLIINFIIIYILILGISPHIFAQVYGWTSGFQNYVPPVLIMLLCLKICFSDLNKFRVIKFILIFILGIVGQLYVEHSTIINLILSLIISIYSFIKRKFNFSYSWFLGTSLGAIIMYSIPKLFYEINKFDGYQKLNVFNLKTLIISIISNSLHITRIYSTNIILFIFISMVLIYLLYKSNVKNNFINILVRLNLVIVPIIFILNYLFINDNNIYISIILLFILISYFASIIYVISTLKSNHIKKYTLFLLIMAIFSTLPLLIVYPIGERCLFHSYIFMTIFILVLINYSFNFMNIKLVTSVMKFLYFIFLIMSVFLSVVFYNIKNIEDEKNHYIIQEMKKFSNEISIPKNPYNYVHSNSNIMITEFYFYVNKGDINFIIEDYDLWREKAKTN